MQKNLWKRGIVMKDNFILYDRYIEVFEQLTDEDAGKLIKAILQYSNTGTHNLDGMLKIIFTPIKQDIDYNNTKYEQICERNKLNGQKGGRPKTQKTQVVFEKTESKTQKPKKADIDIDTDIDIDNDIVVEEEEKEEAPTTTDKVMAFYLNNINSTPVLKEVEVLESYQKDLPDDLIVYAMEKAVDNKARNLAYIKVILNKWIQKGITTLAEAMDEKKQVNTDNRLRDDNVIDYDQFYANL